MSTETETETTAVLEMGPVKWLRDQIKELKTQLRAEKNYAKKIIDELESGWEAEKAARHKRVSELETQLHRERADTKGYKNLVIQLKTQLHDMEGELNRTEGYLSRVREDDQLQEAQANPVVIMPDRSGPQGNGVGSMTQFSDNELGVGYGAARRVPWWEA